MMPRAAIRSVFFSAFMLLLVSCGVSKSLHHVPDLSGYDATLPVVTKKSPVLFTSGDNFLVRNKQSLWELYVSGDPLQIGLESGALTDSLLKKQERVFFSKVKELVPSAAKQKLLRELLKFYNRKLYRNVREEYQAEIYGISQYTSHDFDAIAPRYLRSLYLHAAHDIGHALQDLAIVGCSSFAAWGENSKDGSLILGRNFDFYAGDDFAKDKVVAFVRPKEGHPFMTVTWAGMIGAVSGMNNEGLSVTINAGKSKIPLIAKTPISILTREILQYAKNIDQAVAIAKKRKVFVSESIMVGSAADKKAVLIEVSPNNFGVYEVQNSLLLCTNHFQSDALKNNSRNLYQIGNSHSEYRYERLAQLIGENEKLDPEKAAAILRNKDGLGNLPLGYGNEKALNQLLAHHGVIFKPEQRLVWVSANPYQLGEFVCYDLNAIFGATKPAGTLQRQELNLAEDPFLHTVAFANYEQFRVEDRKMDAMLENKTGLTAEFVQNYQSLNPDYWQVYYKTALYYYQHRQYAEALRDFEKAMTKEITTLPDKQAIEKYLKKTKRKLR